jgi:hypothetical protein
LSRRGKTAAERRKTKNLSVNLLDKRQRSPSRKQKVDRISEAEEHADVCQTPQIEPSMFYPPRVRDPEKPRDPPIEIEVDPIEAAATAAHRE